MQDRGVIPSLDGVRGVAILAVLGHQLLLDGYDAPRWLPRLLAPLQIGWYGVQLFFVLSGFLITNILLTTKGAPRYWSSFFARRALRILPLYYLLITLTLIVAPRAHPHPSLQVPLGDQLWYWAHLANWTPLAGVAVTPLGHTWSLSVEEQFYLLWPVVVRALGPRALVWSSVLIIAGAVALRVALVEAGANPEIAYAITPARADALAMGGLAAIVARDRALLARLAPRLGWAGLATAGALVALLPFSGMLGRTHPGTQLVAYPLLALGSAILILRCVVEHDGPAAMLSRVLSFPTLRRVGTYSYAIYVFHLPAHLLASAWLVPAVRGLGVGAFLAVQLGYLLGGTAVLFALGALSHWALERPLLSLKRFFPPA